MSSERYERLRNMKPTREPDAGPSRSGARAGEAGTAGPGGDPEALREPDETLEPLLRDQGGILQKREGYRFSLDALLLASLVPRLHGAARHQAGIRYADLGTGSGIIPILLSKWNDCLTGLGVEIQPALASMARRNMKLHGLEERFQVLCADLKDLPARFPRGSFDWVTINPPYRKLHSGRMNPDPQKALARHELAATLKDICSVIGYLLRQKGRAFLIYPASRLAGLFSEMTEAGLAPKVLRPVYPRAGEKACWVLVEAVRGGG